MARGAFLVFVGLFVSASAWGWVTNRRTDLDYAAQLKLDTGVTVKSQVGEGHCTGTLLNPTTVILAGHCLDERVKTGGINIEGVSSIAAFTKYIGNAAADAINKEKDPAKAKQMVLDMVRRDVAIAVFPEGFGEFLGVKEYPKIVEKNDSSQRGYFIGYGKGRATMSFDSGAGILGWGTAMLSAPNNGVMEYLKGVLSREERGEGVGDGENISVLEGDSGSSVYGGEGKIIGIVSSIHPNFATETVVRSFGPLIFEVEEEVLKNFDGYIADVTSPESRALFKEAIECAQGTCAGNFVGSGVPAANKPILTSSPAHKNEALFSHRTLRTGRYKCVSEGCTRDDMAIYGIYEGNVLKSIQAHNLLKDHGDWRHPDFTCKDEVCTSLRTNRVTLTVGRNDSFVFENKITDAKFSYVRIK